MSAAAVKQRPSETSGVSSIERAEVELVAAGVHEGEVDGRAGDVRGDLDRGHEAAGQPVQVGRRHTGPGGADLGASSAR